MKMDYAWLPNAGGNLEINVDIDGGNSMASGTVDILQFPSFLIWTSASRN